MSLPPFLFSATAPAASARSPFAATTASAGGDGGGVAAGTDFRRAFMQLTQHKASVAGAAAAAVENAAPLDTTPLDSAPLLAKLNVLLEDDLLPAELRESLRSFLDDMQQGDSAESDDGGLTFADLLQQTDIPQEQLHAIAAAIEGMVAEPTVDMQRSPEAMAVLRDLVDLLTGGKTLPADLPSDAMNLSADPEVDHPISLIASPAAVPVETVSSINKVSADGAISKDLPQAGKWVGFSSWIQDATEAPAASQTKPEVLAGVNKAHGQADMVIKQDPAASSLNALSPAGLELSADLPESASGTTSTAALVNGKSGLIAGLQTPGEAQLQTAMRVQVAFGHAQWSEALAERTAWLASQQIHSAELQLDPPELGPLQVRISVHQDQAVVSFVSANPQVRDALDQSMMRLRDLLQEQGMQLVDAGVSDQQRGRDGDNAGADAAEGMVGAAAAGENLENSQVPDGVMDTRYGVDDFV